METIFTLVRGIIGIMVLCSFLIFYKITVENRSIISLRV